MAYKRRDREFQTMCELASFRDGVAFRTADALMPGATNRRLMRAARRILSACDGKDRSVKITRLQAQDLILPHLQCIDKECPMLCFWEPISRSVNMFFSEEG